MDYRITIRLPDRTANHLKEESRKWGYSINTIIRRILKEWSEYEINQ